MKTITALSLWLATAAQAAALSCAYPNIAETFNWRAEAAVSYLMVKGTLTPHGNLPRQSAGKPAEAAYRFDGVAIGLSGDVPLAREITVTTTCASVWCGALPELEGEVLTFLEQRADTLLLEVGPCPGEMLEAPSIKDISVLRICLAQGRCGPEAIAHFAPKGQ